MVFENHPTGNMDPNIVVKEEREDQTLNMTFGDLCSSTLQQPTTSEEGVSPSSVMMPQRSISTAHLKLDIKPNVHEMEEEDAGQITPPIPRLVTFPVTETDDANKDKEENVGVPMREAVDQLDLSKMSTKIRASTSVPNIIMASQKEYTMNKIVPLELARGDLQRQLDVTRYDFQQYRKKSISAANLLQPDIHGNMVGPNRDNLEHGSINVFPSTAQPIEMREEECQTESQKEADENMAKAISESAATELNAKLKLVEKNTMESFKKIEVRQTSMLEEIRKTNETLEKLLRNVGSTGSTGVEMWMAVPELNDQRSPDDDIDDLVMLHANELNLRQEEWVETANDEDLDEGDYEMMVLDYYPVDRGNDNDSMHYPHKPRANTDAISISPPVHQRDESTTGFVCTCGSKFRLLTTLGDHLLYKNLPRFQCDLCSKQFYKRRDLISHVRNTHKVIVHDDRFVCFSCNNRFSSCLEMFNHKRSCLVLNASTNKGSRKKSKAVSVSSSMEDLMNNRD